MDIKEEIKAKKFNSTNEEVFVNLIYTAAQLEIKLVHLLKSYGISPAQYNALRVLRGEYPNSMLSGLLQERMLHKNSNATRLISRLIDKSYVVRQRNTSDKRKVYISITAEGLSFLNKLDLVVTDFEQQAINLPYEKLKQLSELLDEVRESS